MVKIDNINVLPSSLSLLQLINWTAQAELHRQMKGENWPSVR